MKIFKFLLICIVFVTLQTLVESFTWHQKKSYADSERRAFAVNRHNLGNNFQHDIENYKRLDSSYGRSNTDGKKKSSDDGTVFDTALMCKCVINNRCSRRKRC